MDNRVPENVQNIWQNHKLHHECHGKEESGIDSERTNPNNGKNPMKQLRGRFAHATAIRYNNDAIQLNDKKKLYGGEYKFTKSQEKIYHLIYIDHIKILGKKNEKKRKLETLIQAIRIYSQNKGMKFIIEKCAMLLNQKWKKKKQRKKLNWQTGRILENLARMKATST